MSALNSTGWNRVRYTLYAPFYDLFVGFRGARKRAIELLELEPGARVLVVGAGTGLDLKHLPPGVHVTAGDVAPGMVRRLRRRARALEDRFGSVEIGKLDAHRLPFRDGEFDAVLLHLIVAVVPDPKSCLREAARVLRPGGVASVLDKFAPEGTPPSLARRLLNPIAETLATSVSRQLGALLDGIPLEVEVRQEAAFGGFFEIALLRRIEIT